MAYLIDISANLSGLQAVLRQVHDKMIVHSEELIGVSTAIAAFGALWYIAGHVWTRLANAERIDPRVLARPFYIGLAIVNFPAVLSVIDAVMDGTTAGTAAIFNDSNQAVTTLLQQRQEALQKSTDWQMYVNTTGSGNLDKWEELSGEADSGMFSGVSNRLKFQMAKASYDMRNSVKVWLSEILQVLFESASLCINTVRTFYLVILAILGPLAFAFSVYKGFENSLVHWLSHYLHVFLWLPVANIFGSLLSQIQQEMIRLDISQLNATGQTTFGPTDAAYIIFLVMGIVGYFTVPSVTHYIIRAGGIGVRMWRNRLTW